MRVVEGIVPVECDPTPGTVLSRAAYEAVVQCRASAAQGRSKPNNDGAGSSFSFGFRYSARSRAPAPCFQARRKCGGRNRRRAKIEPTYMPLGPALCSVSHSYTLSAHLQASARDRPLLADAGCSSRRVHRRFAGVQDHVLTDRFAVRSFDSRPSQVGQERSFIHVPMHRCCRAPSNA